MSSRKPVRAEMTGRTMPAVYLSGGLVIAAVILFVVVFA